MSRTEKRFHENKGRFRLEDIWADADEIGGSIRKMERNYPSLKKKVFVLTEGPSDYEFYSRFFNRDACEIRFANSRKNVLAIIDGLLREIPEEAPGSVIGIVDRDFSFFHEKSGGDPGNVFMTDSHDIETMIISDDLIGKVLDIYERNSAGGNFRRKTLAGIREGSILERLIECSRLVGLALYINEKYGLNMIFKHINCKKRNRFTDFTDPSSLKIDEEKLMEVISGRNQDKFESFKEFLLRELSGKSMYYDHPLQICRGHDLMCVLQLEININYPPEDGKKVGLRDLERLCRKLYAEDEFYKTELFDRMQAWEERQKTLPGGPLFKRDDRRLFG